MSGIDLETVLNLAGTLGSGDAGDQRDGARIGMRRTG